MPALPLLHKLCFLSTACPSLHRRKAPLRENICQLSRPPLMPRVMASSANGGTPKRKKAVNGFMAAFQRHADTKADIVMSIRPEHMKNIAHGIKNHEYRKYLLPSSVKRIWFYTSHPQSRIEYVAQIGPGRGPGHVPEDGGLGNEDFNAGKKVSKYGYEIQTLWCIPKPILLSVAKHRGYFKAPPQKYNYALESMLREYRLADMDVEFDRTAKTSKKRCIGQVDGKYETTKNARPRITEEYDNPATVE